nr:hypothetical protein [Ligilactobacillus ruminis]
MNVQDMKITLAVSK